MKKFDYKVVDAETGNGCIYEGYFLENALEEIRKHAKAEYVPGEDFEGVESLRLYEEDNLLWNGETGTIAELVDICYNKPRLGKSVGDYLNAAFCWGSDPDVIATVDEAVMIFLMTNKDGVECFELEGEDRETALEKLGLSGKEAGKVYACGAYNQERWLICFDE